jgi:hypothetical protein
MSACKVESLELQRAFFATVDQSHIKHIKHEVQYDFWLESKQSEVEMLRKELAKVSASGHAVRRGTYAMINEQRKKIEELENRLIHIERGLCYGK